MAWRVLDEDGAVEFSGFAGPLPWAVGSGVIVSDETSLIVLPRAHPSEGDCSRAEALAARGVVAVLTPQDVDRLAVGGAVHMRHPDGVSALDRVIASRLLESRVGRR